MHNLTWPHNRADYFIFSIWIHIIFQSEEKFAKFWSIYRACNSLSLLSFFITSFVTNSKWLFHIRITSFWPTPYWSYITCNIRSHRASSRIAVYIVNERENFWIILWEVIKVHLRYHNVDCQWYLESMHTLKIELINTLLLSRSILLKEYQSTQF